MISPGREPADFLSLERISDSAADVAPAGPDRSTLVDSTSAADAAGIWLDGDVLMCACPECGAPLSVRRWLMMADCWRCRTTMALTEEQERAAEQLLSAQKAARRGSPAARPRDRRAAAEPASRPVESRPDDVASRARAPHRQTRQRPEHVASPPPRSARSEVVRRPTRARARLQRVAEVDARQLWFHRLLSSLPGWLTSALFHLLLLLILALWLIEPGSEQRFIILSTELGRHRQVGGIEPVIDPENELRFDLPVPPESAPSDPKERTALIQADQEARELRIDPDAREHQLPELNRVKSVIASPDQRARMLAVRDPRVRIDMIKREGGTTLTEAAVARGLRWMSRHQNEDGSWSLHAFDKCKSCQGRCGGQGTVQSDSAGTSLVLLPFLGAGQTHLVGRYKGVVSYGLRWLTDRQKPDGDLRARSTGNAGMYAHGQATIVLCEALAMTGDQQLRDPAQRAVDFIVRAQHIGGGWRYKPGQPGDTSVLGWQLMALQSARAARLNVPAHTLENASHYLNSVSSDGGSRYSYIGGRNATHVMSAEALLCRMYLGWTLHDPGLRLGLEQLAAEHPPTEKDMNIYYWYYATQAMHHAGGAVWDEWNHHMRQILVRTQEQRGHQAGSWAARENHDKAGGRLYATALATCILEVYYRHAPIFRQIQLD